MKRKTPWQVAREAFYKSANSELSHTECRCQQDWEAAATAVLAEPLATLKQLLDATTATDFQALYDARANARELLELMPLPQPPVDPYATLKAAHAAGKVIQFRGKAEAAANDWSNPLDLVGNYFSWDYPVDQYRIKPWELSRHIPGFRPLEGGEEWLHQDFTDDTLPTGYRPLLKGEHQIPEDEEIFDDGEVTHSLRVLTDWQCLHNKVRTTRPLPPTKEELETQAFDAWWNDYKLGCVDITPNRDTAFAAWQAARATKHDHEKA